jgi:hypothetical protein
VQLPSQFSKGLPCKSDICARRAELRAETSNSNQRPEALSLACFPAPGSSLVPWDLAWDLGLGLLLIGTWWDSPTRQSTAQRDPGPREPEPRNPTGSKSQNQGPRMTLSGTKDKDQDLLDQEPTRTAKQKAARMRLST